MSLFIVHFLLFFSNAFANVEAVIGDVPLDKNPNLIGTVSADKTSEVIISRDQYVISYNRARRSMNWVAWKIEASQLGNSGRTDLFAPDLDLQTYLQDHSSDEHPVDPAEYQGSCFDRGHQIPSADRTDSAKNNEATFLMSNMIPQTPYLNRVIWEHLEHYTRELVRNGKKVYLVAGPVYDKDFGAIGPKGDIPVPSKDFKIIVILEANQTPQDIDKNTPIISVVMPNILEDGSDPTNHSKLCSDKIPHSSSNMNDWEQYKTTLPKLKRISGISISTLKNLDLETDLETVP